MKIRQLKTVEEVVAAIGRARLQEITGRRSQNITNWLSDGRFPPTTHLICQIELAHLHCRAPGSLWGQMEPRKAARVSA